MKLTVSGLFRPGKLFLLSFWGVVLFGSQTAAFAADYIWDTNKNEGIQAGNGTWGTDNYWTRNGTTLVAWPGPGNSVIFSANDTSAVTVVGIQDVDSMAFLENGYTLSDGTINFGTKNGLVVASGKTATINSVIAGTGGLKIYATSTSKAILNLNGANTYTGVTTINSNVRLNVSIIADGGVNSGIGKSSSSASNLVLNGGILRHTGGAASTDRLFTLTEKGGFIYASGSGPLNFTNTGAIAFSGSGARSLEIGGATTVENLFSPVIGDGTGGSTTLKKSGPGIVVLTGTNTYSGGTTISTGTLQIGNGGTTGSITGNVTNNDTLAFNRSDAYTFAGDISGSGAVIQSGTGTLTLSGTNTFTGGITVSEGIIKTGNNQALGDFGNSITVSSGAALDVNGYNLQGYTNDIVINGQRDDSTGALINTGAEQLNAIRKISLGSDASIGNNGSRFDIGRNIVGSTCITGNSHTLSKVGTNFISILGNATNLAGVVVNGGNLCLEADAAAGTAPITINNGATLESWGNRTFSNIVNINDGGTLSSQNATWGDGGTTTVHNGAFTVTGNATMTTPATVTMTINGVIGGTGSLTKTGPNGTLILKTVNTYAGTTSISAGTLRLGIDNAIPPTSVLSIGQNATLDATLDLNTFDQTIAGLAGSGSTGGTQKITSGGGTRTLTINSSTNHTYSYIIEDGAGKINLVKTGTGTQTLAGNNTYTGTTTVSEGTLNVTGSLAAGSAVTVTGTLTGTGTVAGSVNASGGTIAPGNGPGPGKLSTGALTLNGTSNLNFDLGTVSDTIAVNGNIALNGTLNISALDGFAAGDYTLITYTGNLSDNGLTIGTLPPNKVGVIKAANGIVTLTVSNSYPPTGISLSNDTVLDSLAPGAVVGLLTATDPDIEEHFEFELIAGPGSTDNDSFYIEDNTLFTNVMLYHEIKDSLSIRVKVTDRDGLKYEKEFSIHVVSAPKIITQPQNMTVKEDSTAVFSIEAKGSPLPGYTWYKVPSTVVGTGAKLTLENTTMDMNGSRYICRVHNSYDTIFSDTVSLTVVEQPEIVSFSGDTNVIAGQNTSFLISSTGSRPLTYTWIKSKGSATDTLTDGDSLLSVPAMQSDSGATFKCVVSNMAGTVVSQTKTLHVLSVPTVTAPLDLDTTVIDGDTVIFSLQINGTLPFTYKWFKNGLLDSVGASKNLTLDGVGLSDSGYYLCVVSNAAGKDTSDTIFLHVNPAPPEIISQPQELAVSQGDDAVFRVGVKGTPEFTYSWFKTGSADTLSKTDSLLLKDVSVLDSNTSYYCIVNNRAGTDTSDSAALYVYTNGIPPKDISSLSDKTVHEGDTAVFVARGSGTAPLKYTWYLDREETDSLVAESDTLRLPGVLKSDSGNVYYCIISNVLGHVTTSSVTLHVLDPLAAPGVTLDPVSKSKYTGDSVTFVVSATGNPLPQYQWERDGIPIDGEKDSILTVKGLKLTDNNSRFVCMVYNSQDTVYSDTAVLTIVPPPVAGFAVQPETKAGLTPMSVTFTDTSKGEVTSRKWLFGDGASSTLKNTEHVYESKGEFYVQLIITGPSGKDTAYDTINVFDENENPVLLKATFLKNRDIRIELNNYADTTLLRTKFPPPWVDSIGIWIREDSLPSLPSSSTRIAVYDMDELLKSGKTYADTLTLPEGGELFGLMNGLYWQDKKISHFDPRNGFMVLMRDTVSISNPLSLSGLHLGGDSAQFKFTGVNDIDDQRIDSVGFWYGIDSTSISFTGSGSRWFSLDKISGSDQYVFNIKDGTFEEDSRKVYCAVVLKGKNGLLSPQTVASFTTVTISVDNPIILSAEAISPSKIELSWPKITDPTITKIQIWISKTEIKPGTVDFTGKDSARVSPQDTSYIFTNLESETRYYFAAQVYKNGKWSPVTANACASAETPEPDDTRVDNSIKLNTPVFDTFSASIKLSWCLDSATFSDSLNIGITWSNTHYPDLFLDPLMIVEAKTVCQQTVLDLKENPILFDTTYYFSLWLRKGEGKWMFPTDSSRGQLKTPPFKREIVTFFKPGAKEVSAFNGTVVLWKDDLYPSTALTTDTISVYPGRKSYEGMIPLGTGFSFLKREPTPAFFIGMRYNELPDGVNPEDIRIYRDNGKSIILEHGTVLNPSEKIAYIKTSDLRYPFILMIDTMPPKVSFGDTSSVGTVGKNIRDTVYLSDNIQNLYWKYMYGKGDEAPSHEKSDTLSKTSDKLNLVISSDQKVINEDNGVRIYLIVSDGVHLDTFNLSRRVKRSKSDPSTTTAKSWYPLFVTGDLKNTSPDSAIVKLLEDGVSGYDTRYLRLFRWIDDGSNKSDDRWCEYNESNSSLFDFTPGRLIWVKTLKGQSLDFGPGTTLSLKEDFSIKLPPEEWTDFGLPFRFDIRLADILESNTEFDSLHFYSWVSDSTDRFSTAGIFVPGFPDKQDPNTILDFSNGGGFSVYNPYKKAVTLKIPPVPTAMSPERPKAKKAAKGSIWSVKVICRTDSGAKLPDLYCGYAEANTFCRYPSAPSFSSAKVNVFDRETNHLYGHHIAGSFDGAISREIAFSNNSRSPVTVKFDLQKAGTFPTGINASLLDPSSGEWQSRGSVTVAAGSTEYRWLVAADEAYREMFKAKTLSFKYALRSVYPNPFRSVAHIRYTVPTGAKETLRFTLHDALGRRVWEKVINGSRLSVGEHSITWDGQDLKGKKVHSGAYFLSLSVIDSGKRTIKKFQSKLTFIP